MIHHWDAQWGVAAAIAAHALVHLGHLIDNAKMRRELRRARPVKTPEPSRKEQAQ